MKTFMLGTAVALLLASPALAQGYNPDMGTGNVVPPLSYELQGADAFAMEPAPAPSKMPQLRGMNRYSPDLCGGGSSGYNEHLEKSCR